jgi:hypothetical protein
MSRALPCVQKFDFASSRPHQVASKLQIGQDGASCARALCADVRSAHADAVVEAAPETGAAPGWKQSVRRRPCSRLAGCGGTAHAPDGGQRNFTCLSRTRRGYARRPSSCSLPSYAWRSGAATGEEVCRRCPRLSPASSLARWSIAGQPWRRCAGFE